MKGNIVTYLSLDLLKRTYDHVLLVNPPTSVPAQHGLNDYNEDVESTHRRQGEMAYRRQCTIPQDSIRWDS